jgi:hypothetical protein
MQRSSAQAVAAATVGVMPARGEVLGASALTAAGAGGGGAGVEVAKEGTRGSAHQPLTCGCFCRSSKLATRCSSQYATLGANGLASNSQEASKEGQDKAGLCFWWGEHHMHWSRIFQDPILHVPSRHPC